MNYKTGIITILLAANVWYTNAMLCISNIDTLFTDTTYVVLSWETKQKDSILTKKSYYLDGTKMENVRTLNGFREGKYEFWYKNGTKMSEENYKKGILEGDYVGWYPSGNLEYRAKLKKGVGTLITYYESGEIKAVEAMNGDEKPKGTWNYFCKNGQLIKQTDWQKDDYIFSTYHCNGELKQQGRLLYNSVAVGLWKEWYDNGTLKAEGNYIEISPNSVVGEKDGTWKYYSKSGNLDRSEVWDRGKLIFTNY